MRLASRLLAGAVVFCSTLSFAGSPSTNRAMNNVKSAINSVQLLPELLTGPIPREKKQTAENLLRDLEYALKRGEGELSRVPEADKEDPVVVEVTKKLAEFATVRDQLKASLEGGSKASAAADGQFRAFREETRPWARVVGSFRNGPHGTVSELQAGVAELAKLDALCKSKYPGIADDQYLSFQLAIEPGTWCSVASRREEIFKTAVKEGVEKAWKGVLAEIDEARENLAKNEGLIAEDGRPYKALLDRAKTKTTVAGNLKPALAAAGETFDEQKAFKELDEKLDAFAAEIDRLAPTWPFVASFHAPQLEAGASAYFKRIYQGQVLKTGLLVQAASIDKNALGIPTERYRTGAMLSKGKGKWCEYRQWTAHETYSGGGGYAAPTYTIGAMRLQKCP